MKTHSQTIGEQCVKNAKRQWGNNWRHLSPRQRKAEVCMEICSVLLTSAAIESPDVNSKASAFDHVAAIAREAVNQIESENDRGAQ